MGFTRTTQIGQDFWFQSYVKDVLLSYGGMTNCQRVGYFVILAASIHPEGETCLRLAVATYFLIEASRQVSRKREMILGAKLCSRRSKHFPPIVGHHDRSLECAAGEVY